MKILFDEVSYAEKISKGLVKRITSNDLKILAKYYRYLGYSKDETRTKLNEFCQIHFQHYNAILWEDRILSAVKETDKRKIRVPMDVPITIQEIERIKSIKNYKYEKVLFALLVAAKYNRIYSESEGKNCSGYFVQAPLERILYEVKMNLIKKDKDKMGFQMRERGFIRPTQIGVDGGLEIFYVREDSPISFVISNFNNILSYYPPYCKVCGESLEKRDNRQQMHNDCFEEQRRINEGQRLKDFMRQKRNVTQNETRSI